ncbi:unnamed protein product, partial [Mesorhabditis spiculigera]
MAVVLLVLVFGHVLAQPQLLPIQLPAAEAPLVVSQNIDINIDLDFLKDLLKNSDDEWKKNWDDDSDEDWHKHSHRHSHSRGDSSEEDPPRPWPGPGPRPAPGPGPRPGPGTQYRYRQCSAAKGGIRGGPWIVPTMMAGFRGREISSNIPKCKQACYRAPGCQGIEVHEGKCYQAWGQWISNLPRSVSNIEWKAESCFLELKKSLVGMPRWYIVQQDKHAWNFPKPPNPYYRSMTMNKENGMFCISKSQVTSCNLVQLSEKDHRLSVGLAGTRVGYVAKEQGECGAHLPVWEYRRTNGDYVYLPAGFLPKTAHTKVGRLFYAWVNYGDRVRNLRNCQPFGP